MITCTQQKESELGLWTPGSHKYDPKPQYGAERPHVDPSLRVPMGRRHEEPLHTPEHDAHLQGHSGMRTGC